MDLRDAARTSALAAALLQPTFAHAQPDTGLTVPAPAQQMTLGEAIAFAREHQPSLQMALARVRAAEAEARVPRAQWLPSVGATAQAFVATENNSTASYLGVRSVDLPRIGGTRVSDSPSWSPSPSTLAAVGVDQEVFDFGRVALQSAVADGVVTAERFGAESERARVDLLVKESFFAVLGARAVLQAATDAHTRSKAHSDLAAAGVKSGLHAPIELTRAQADLTRFDVARVQATGNLRTAQAMFAAAVGSPEPVLDAAGQPGQVAAPVPLAEALQSLSRRDPLVRAAGAQLDTQRALTRAVAAQMRPDVVLSAGLSGRAGGATPTSGPVPQGDGWLPDVPNWHAGLVLRWPIYDPLVRARAHSASAREEVAAASLSTVYQQEAAQLQRAYVQFQVARSSLVALERATEAARANYAQAEARFKAGLGTALELADAESVRTGAEIQQAIGQFDLSRARALIARLLAEEP
jgi:outer membrane protein